MRTDREIEAEADRRASQAMTAGGWEACPGSLRVGVQEEQYWEEWGEAYDDAMFDLEAENETDN
jgi:hypothetical protein